MTISASHTRDGRVLGWFSVFDGQGKLWGQVNQRLMADQRPGLPEVFMWDSSFLWWWEFLLEQCLPCFLKMGQNSRKTALLSWLQWHWTKRCKKSSREVQWQPWWSPQVIWESNSAHTFKTSIYHDKHLCSSLPTSIYTYFFFKPIPTFSFTEFFFSWSWNIEGPYGPDPAKQSIYAVSLLIDLAS